jgi:EAL domain-containing protein (putative c-di-GMP-specific phosphodiesterase class I)
LRRAKGSLRTASERALAPPPSTGGLFSGFSLVPPAGPGAASGTSALNALASFDEYGDARANAGGFVSLVSADVTLRLNHTVTNDFGGSARVRGFEALVRLQHTHDSAIGPTEFLPIAEEAGLMVRVTDFVLHCACRQLKAWQKASPAHAALTMNVNVSGHDIAHPALLARVSRALVESGVAPQHLCIELTENILMSRLEGALGTLTELKRLGVLLAIDDFGTGYSSLSHLSTLPLDCLKIDRSFVARLDGGNAEEAVVRSIVLLGSSLGKAVVAEGIETEEQLQRLRRLGCRYGQGYLLGRPMKPHQVSSVLAGDPVTSALHAATSPMPWASPTIH